MDAKLGPQLANGGISGFLERFFNKFNKVAEWLHLDRALNILIWWQTLHNGYMLSSNLGQTLFSTISNVLAVIGIKDAEGQPLNIGEILGGTIENIAKSALGVDTFNGIKAQWKRYNRIYQAAANLFNTLQSIGYSILSALEVVGNYVASIGNALRRAGEVMENAYNWMNPTPNFQNRFFTFIDNAENFVQSIDQVASEVLEVQEQFKQLGEVKKELDDAIGQKPETAQGAIPSEPKQIATEAAKSKTNSKAPLIKESDKIKPNS
jgi:hypothetical protein